MNESSGFTLIELLVVIAIIAILTVIVLVSVSTVRGKSLDARIKTSVSQMRWLAESVYDEQGASYLNWSQNANIQTQLIILLADIDKAHGNNAASPYDTVIRDTQAADFCISTKLQTSNKKYCVDATGVFKSSSNSQCAVDDGVTPLRCP